MAEFQGLNLAVLTVSDSRTHANDSSGQYLVDQALAAGHGVSARHLIPDDVYLMRALVSRWIADPEINVVLITGGTGFHERDSTPEALVPLFDKQVDGFGEEFRRLSAAEIGSSTIQSRARAGLANHTLIFSLPGSTGACRTGWEGILLHQLDNRHRPCNFSQLARRKPDRDLTPIDIQLPLDPPLTDRGHGHADGE
ncbi:molybdenum cofactor biosynthesis protein B [Hydrocarboniclastica marina]|uniref:Molybdenum cofactor biosynthesis protein B n=1 Tax=Hydrocarboniclastica marina TaxID=2259620 RepID=A0A4P7XKM6_9ALTE|nr:molybdenum cofactor biosynthesis protein B [Hydrocarboniclastica marina]MAL97227.1 molybdenum cofactor biosynthesis protein B [Alteromonadaceae bacterium]QCF27373.1 molybdenum cofactor biosynthesis protein B [Hydrocarboniclastica marina]|tara:strand:+ start:4404 stop:4994 length:591 start_codon:yes stop_codon:yes gene_type:complete